MGQLEALSTTGTTTTTTMTYYYAGGKRIALAVNGSFYYLGSDGLGSASVALDSTGNVQTSVLYGPYGTTRYTNGTMPGSYGYTGQHADATTGLDYYNARYYDASAGQFASADTARDGLNRYGYVHGNPTTMSDPSGHCGGSSSSGSTGGNNGSTGSGSSGGGGPGHVGDMADSGCLDGGGQTPVTYQCNNVCVAGNLAHAANQFFGWLAGISAFLGLILGMFISGITFGWGVFLAAAAVTALGVITLAAAAAASSFSSFNAGEASDVNNGGSAYFTQYHQEIANDLAAPATAVFALGTLLTFVLQQPLAAVTNGAWSVTLKSLAAAGTSANAIIAAGISVGFIIGALATLLILVPLAEEWYIQPQYALLYGNEQQCGNNDKGIDILCPAAA